MEAADYILDRILLRKENMRFFLSRTFCLCGGNGDDNI
jgi:hypothetical protein